MMLADFDDAGIVGLDVDNLCVCVFVYVAGCVVALVDEVGS